MSDVIHIDSGRMRPDNREALIEWVKSLGIEPRDIRAQVLIKRGEREWELHVSRFLRDDRGAMRIDRAIDDVASEPVVILIGTQESWPTLGTQGIS